MTNSDYPEHLLAREAAPRYAGEGPFALWHYSEDSSLGPFLPPRPGHQSAGTAAGLGGRYPARAMFWFPRDCPRGCIWPVSTTTAEDRDPVLPISTGGTSGGQLVNQAATLIRAGLASNVVCVAPNTFDGPVDLQEVINTNSPMVMEQPLGMGAVHMGAFFPAAYQERYGVTDEDLLAVAAKNRENADHNRFAHVTTALSPELAARMISTPLTLGMVCPVSSGAIAMVISAEDQARRRAANPLVRITAYGSISDGYLGGTRRDFAAFEVVEIMARRLYREAGVLTPGDEIDVAELFCPYGPMEFMLLEGFGFCAPGQAPELLRNGVTKFGGSLPVNLSGGPQCTNPGVAGQIAPMAHIALQLMGQAATRQVEGCQRGLAHSTGGTFFQFHTGTLMDRVG